MLSIEQGKRPYLAECPVVEKEEPAAGFFLFKLQAPLIAGEAEPGQFVQVFIPFEHRHNMLPRPFSIFEANREKKEIAILIGVRGRGTALLAASEPGSTWRLMGPLGRGFPLPLPPSPLLVAGGMGIVPLAFLARSTSRPRTLIHGARTAAQLVYPRSELDQPGLKLLEATDDGSRGVKGTACDLLTGLIREAGAVFACGPRPMLARVQEICRCEKTAAWLSLEEHMACGIGACVGCAVQTVDGYRRVCRDGPVFSAEEVEPLGLS